LLQYDFYNLQKQSAIFNLQSSMKINRFGRAEILTPDQINLLFNEGFVNPRDIALCLACAFTLLAGSTKLALWQ
jgi:hypothetical protein